MAAALDAGADERGPRRPAGDAWREPGDRHARDRGRPLGGDRAAVEDRDRDAGRRRRRGRRRRGSPGSPRSAFAAPKPATHLIPSRSSAPSSAGAAQEGRHRVGERPVRPWMDADLRRQLGVGDQRGHRPLGQREPLLERRHRRPRRRPPTGSAGAAVGRRHRRGQSRRRGRLPSSRWPRSTSRRASTTSSSSATRSSSTTPWPRIEQDPRPRGRLRADRLERAAPRRHLGREADRARGDGPARRPARGSRVRFIVLIARLFGTKAGRRPGQGARGRRGGRSTTPRASRPRSPAIAADEREHAEIWDRLASGEARPTRRRPASPRRAAPGRPRRSASARRWHRTGGRSGTLRAVIFGVSDGLVSNLSLVMGVAGAATGNPSFILLAGIAGLLAGRVQHGRRRVHLDAEPARAVRAPDRAGAGRDGGDARGGGGRAGRRLPGQGLRRRTRPRGSPTASSPTRRRRSTRSSARSSASTPTSSGRRSGRPPARSSRSRSARPSRSCRTSFGGGHGGRSSSASAISLVALFAVGARGQPADRARPALLGLPPARDRPRGGARDVRDRLDHRRLGGRVGRWRRWRRRRTLAERLARRGLAAVAVVERAGRPVRRPRARLRQGARRQPRARSGSGCRMTGAVVDLAAGDRLDLPAGTATTRASGRTASPASRRTPRPGRSARSLRRRGGRLVSGDPGNRTRPRVAGPRGSRLSSARSRFSERRTASGTVASCAGSTFAWRGSSVPSR